ncbi:MAG: HAD family hydrolase [Candidatus Heimdallarchaeota archaeon]|nr:HAD family hydrolase [Candidatus Heimdallarchaeota archaeon]
MESNDLHNYFESYFGFDTVAATKHTMRYYRNMTEIVKADPKMCVMVGNSMHEVLKPRKLGMKTVHVNRERKVPMDIRRLADKSIKDLSSLPAHLDVMQIHH